MPSTADKVNVQERACHASATLATLASEHPQMMGAFKGCTPSFHFDKAGHHIGATVFVTENAVPTLLSNPDCLVGRFVIKDAAGADHPVRFAFDGAKDQIFDDPLVPLIIAADAMIRRSIQQKFRGETISINDFRQLAADTPAQAELFAVQKHNILGTDFYAVPTLTQRQLFSLKADCDYMALASEQSAIELSQSMAGLSKECLANHNNRFLKNLSAQVRRHAKDQINPEFIAEPFLARNQDAAKSRVFELAIDWNAKCASLTKRELDPYHSEILRTQRRLDRLGRSKNRDVNLTKEEERFLMGLIQEDAGFRSQALEILTVRNRGLVADYVKKKKGSGDHADRIADGFLGLIEAAEKFNLGTEYRYSTYACQWVRQAVGRGSGNYREFRLPAHFVEDSGKVLKLLEEQQRGAVASGIAFVPDAEQIAEALKVPIETVKRILNPAKFLSLDHPMGDEGRKASELIGADPTDQSIQMIVSKENRAVLETFVRDHCYNDNEKATFRGRFMTDPQKKLEEIGVTRGITRERVRQIEYKVKERFLSLVDNNDGVLSFKHRAVSATPPPKQITQKNLTFQRSSIPFNPAGLVVLKQRRISANSDALPKTKSKGEIKEKIEGHWADFPSKIEQGDGKFEVVKVVFKKPNEATVVANNNYGVLVGEDNGVITICFPSSYKDKLEVLKVSREYLNDEFTIIYRCHRPQDVLTLYKNDSESPEGKAAAISVLLKNGMEKQAKKNQAVQSKPQPDDSIGSRKTKAIASR